MSRGDGTDKVGYFAVIFCIGGTKDKVRHRRILEDSWKCFIRIALVEVYAA